MRKFAFLILAAMLAASPKAWAEETEKPKVLSGPASGGMTYSPTEGWVKTNANQMRVGTDTLTYSAKQKAAKEAEAQRVKEWARKTAEEEAKEKVWQETLKKAEEAKKAPAQASAPAPKKKKNQPAVVKSQVKTSVQGSQKLEPKSRVFVS